MHGAGQFRPSSKEIRMPRLKLVLASLLFTSPAFAQVSAGGDMNGGMGGGNAGTGGEGGGSMVESKAIIDRAYVIPAGKIEVEGQYLIFSQSSTNPLTM